MKKKILYIHHGGSGGGAPRSLSFLIDRLDKDKYKPYVLCCHDEDGNRALFEAVGAEFYYEKYMGGWHGSTVSGFSGKILSYNIKHCIPTYFNVLKRVREIKPDIVHLNSTCLFMAAKAVKAVDKNIPVVCHVREPLLEGFWGNILRKNCKRYVDHFIAIEKYDADSLGEQKVPIDIIYNFVDFNIYNSERKSNCLRNELNIGQNEKILLYLARVVKQNGALEMLKALESFLKNNKKVHMVVAGADFSSAGSYLLGVKNIAEKHENVHVLPFRQDVPNVIASSDVMVVPFQEPHFARSIIEAGAMGVPTIASDIPGPQELVVDGKTGFLVDYKTFDRLAEKCELLLNNDELRIRMGKNAEVHAKENFAAVKNARRTFEIYERLSAE